MCHDPFNVWKDLLGYDGAERVFLRFVHTTFKGGSKTKMDRQEIYRLIDEERDRQDLLHPKTIRRKSDSEDVEIIANLIDQMEYLAVLVEEVGEVGKAMQGDGDLKEELIQTASCCVRWVECL
jgi:NTP pyrophosphatase (non-canonical NTP hydrolase)